MDLEWLKSAYSSGKPALGVGPGNVPCYIEKTADIKQAVNDLILSKTFDNGMICASEQAVIIEEKFMKKLVGLMKAIIVTLLHEKKKNIRKNSYIIQKRSAVNPKIVGKSPYKIAQMAGFNVPKDTKILVAELDGVGEDYPLIKRKIKSSTCMYKS